MQLKTSRFAVLFCRPAQFGQICYNINKTNHRSRMILYIYISCIFLYRNIYEQNITQRRLNHINQHIQKLS